MANALVAYYSWSNGNTEGIAERAAEALGADLVRIETVEPYTGDYDDVVERAKREVEQGFMPEIEPVDLSGYDTVVVGTPTWWYTMAPAVARFLAEGDWQGRRVCAFMTHAGWPGTVIEDMEEATAAAGHGPSLEVQFDSAGGDRQVTSNAEVEAWLDELKEYAEA